MRFSIFATLFLVICTLAMVSEARYRLKYPKGEFGAENFRNFDARLRRSPSTIDTIKVKRSSVFDHQQESFIEQKRGEGTA